jgi:hypothetical protein
MTKEAMLKEMFLELGQVDLKAIGRSRGFDPQTIASPQLMQHVFLSEQGVAAALASLSEAEFLGLHLAKYPVPEHVVVSVRDFAGHYGRLQMMRDARGWNGNCEGDYQPCRVS